MNTNYWTAATSSQADHLRLNQFAQDFLDMLRVDFPVKVEFANTHSMYGMDGVCRIDSSKGTVTSITIQIRRRPTTGSIPHILAHEVAHAWQAVNGKALDENEAEQMACSIYPDYHVWG